jgi:hypothetical protein
MKQLLVSIACFLTTILQAQSNQYLSVAFTDNASAYPFGILVGYFEAPLHPGVEIGWGKTFKQKPKHDWYRELKLGYFYHRFVQHGISLSLNYGYRYKFPKHFVADVALGAGYFHSIAATEVLKLDDKGNYENAKGIGRPQIMGALTLGGGYIIPLKNGTPLKLWLQYQTRIQAPFVNAYVPILPYDQLALGVTFTLPSNKKKKA